MTTGQSVYFDEQFVDGGLGSLRLKPQDMEDAKFIASCFDINFSFLENMVFLYMELYRLINYSL